VIETERLLLRRYRPGDAGDLAALYSDAEVLRFIPALAGFDVRRARERIAADEHCWQVLGQRHLAVIERATEAFLGRAAVHDWPQFGETEVGWILAAHARGHGYATEAGRACLAWAFAHLPVPYVTAMIRPDNARSLAVARRLGMASLRDEDLNGTRVLVLAITRERWTAATA